MFKNKGIFLIHTLPIAAILLLFDISFCASQPQQFIPTGGPCEYTEIPGVATIVSIKKADSSRTYCKNTLEVLFNFVPDDPTVE